MMTVRLVITKVNENGLMALINKGWFHSATAMPVNLFEVVTINLAPMNVPEAMRMAMTPYTYPTPSNAIVQHKA